MKSSVFAQAVIHQNFCQFQLRFKYKKRCKSDTGYIIQRADSDIQAVLNPIKIQEGQTRSTCEAINNCVGSVVLEKRRIAS